MSIGLLSTSTLTITRSTGKPVLQADRTFSAGATTTFSISCSVQPFAGISQKILPEGMTASDSRIIYTDTQLQTSSQFTDLAADTTVIGGLTYECFMVEDWNQFSLATDHYKCIFVRKDQSV